MTERGSVIAIEGLIGVGKTTAGTLFIERRNESSRCAFFEEKVNEELLQLFLSDMTKYAFAFQLSMLESRINVQKEAKAFAKTGGTAIIDRSTIGDRAFARLHYEKGNISPQEWDVYNSIFSSALEHSPDKIVFFDCHPQVSLDRIRKRDRAGETRDYTYEYLEQLSKCYESSLRETYMIPIVRLEWNKDRTTKEIVELLHSLF